MLMHMTQPDWPVERFRVLLDRILEQTGLPQGKLAALVPMNQSQFSRWKSAKAKPKFESLAAFAEAIERDFPQLGITKREILGSGGYGDTLDGDPVGGTSARPSNGLPYVGVQDAWTRPPEDVDVEGEFAVDWGLLTPGERWAWHTPGVDARTRYMMSTLAKAARQKDIEVDRISRGLDRQPDAQRSKGANGA